MEVAYSLAPIATEALGIVRDPKWEAVRHEAVVAHPYCANCGGTALLQVHHKYPVGWPNGKATELDKANLIVLCESPGRNCHLWIGHLGDFHSRNVDVEKDAAHDLEKIRKRPYPAQALAGEGDQD